MDRRAFLKLGVGGAALLAAPPVLVRDAAAAEPAPGAFGHGVASGDPLPDRVVLWTRVTPTPEATPGSGVGPDTDVTWQVARDPGFATVIASGTAVATAAADHTVKVDPTGLPPATDLWYRFTALGETSPVGRTRTAPAPGAAVDLLRIGVVSCSNYEGGWFSAYRHLAARDDLDLVVHLGDYLYEQGVGSYGPGPAIGRSHDPVHEMVTLEDYRRRHALYKTDADLAALHARHPMVTTIDDHEVTDNSWAGGANNHQPGEGPYPDRQAAAFQAYFEWMPIRATGGADDPNRIWRHLPYGGLVDLLVLDERTHRSQQVAGAQGDMIVTDPAVADPSRTMLGAAQLAWFEQALAASTATWKVVCNPVMFAPFVLADLADLGGLTDEVAPLLATLGISPPIVLNGDQWDGYRAEQARLVDRFAATGGVVLLTGDIHSTWAAEIPADPGTYLPAVGGDSVAVELVVPGATSDSLAESLARIVPGLGEQIVEALPTVIDVAAPWYKHVDLERHGFGVLEITPAHVHHDWSYVNDRTDPNATLVDGPSFRSPAGSNRLVPAGRLGPRPVPVVEAPPAPTAAVGGGIDVLPATGGSVPLAAAAVATTAGLAARALARRGSAPPPPEHANPQPEETP